MRAWQERAKWGQWTRPMTARRAVPKGHWRSYGYAPLPTTGAEALDEPFSGFPSWFMRITCDRCGKNWMVNEAQTAHRDLPIRDTMAAGARRALAAGLFCLEPAGVVDPLDVRDWPGLAVLTGSISDRKADSCRPLSCVRPAYGPSIMINKSLLDFLILVMASYPMDRGDPHVRGMACA
jgi:hypothetical protein